MQSMPLRHLKLFFRHRRSLTVIEYREDTYKPSGESVIYEPEVKDV